MCGGRKVNACALEQKNLTWFFRNTNDHVLIQKVVTCKKRCFFTQQMFSFYSVFGLTWWTKTSKGGSTGLPSLLVIEINPKPIRTLNHLQNPVPDRICGRVLSSRSLLALADLSSPPPLPGPPATATTTAAARADVRVRLHYRETSACFDREPSFSKSANRFKPFALR